jgi:hypothetical protein
MLKRIVLMDIMFNAMYVVRTVFCVMKPRTF